MRTRNRCHLAVELLEPRTLLATYYVALTGSDGAAGSESAPWQTLQTAAGRVRAGDTVVVRAGAYTGFDLRTDGTAAAPITFRADPGVSINARNPRTPDGINLEGADYVVIDGFEVNNMPRTGIRTVTNRGVVIRNNRMDSNSRWGILTGFSEDLLIENNVTARSVIEHGIYVSNSADRPVVRNNVSWGNARGGIQLNADASLGGDGIITGALLEGNVIYDNGRGGGAAINWDGVSDSVIRNNLLYNNHASGIALFRIDGAAGSRNNLVVNNTIVMASDARWALLIANASTGNTVLNNVLYNNHPTRGAINLSSDSRPGFTSDYNAVISRFTLTDGASVLSLAAWRSATGQDAHSFVTTPAALFVSGSDYHLSATSPARDTGTAASAPAVDLDGRPRPSGAGYDVGAYEYQVPGAEARIVDNRDPGYYELGDVWFDWDGAGYAGHSRWAVQGFGENWALWQVTGLAPGSYAVQTTWTTDPGNASQAYYFFWDGDTYLDLAFVDQRLAPSGTVVGGMAFQTLAAVTVTSGILWVGLPAYGDGYLIADAVRVVPGGAGAAGVAGFLGGSAADLVNALAEGLVVNAPRKRR